MKLEKRPDVDYNKLDEIIVNYSDNLKVFYILKSSIDLKLYDYLNEYKSFEEISDIINIKPILSHYILEILSKIDIIKKKDGLYKNSRLADAYLNTDSLYSKTKGFILAFERVKLWEDLIKTMKGNIKREDNDHFPLIIQVMAENTISGDLYDVVNLVNDLNEFKKAKKFLEIGGGHGFYTIALNDLNPNMEAYVFDLENVIKETKKYIEKYDSKVKTISGDFYIDDFGENYDIIFSSYNPSGKNPDVAKKVHKSLNVGGLFITKQYFPLEKEGNDLKELLDNFEWNLADLTKSRKGKRAYVFKNDLCFKNYISFLEELGFEIIGTHNVLDISPFTTATANDKIIIAKKLK
ncbi:MAG: class I SAM-dependent methyltransferase [Methanobrevibacter sp.]|jgi:predicted O-methyltransferase YrrM|nr:class I SAM-dependent methyltransferase [Methanobrevibacter sp.]